jgi:hypothetical protein
VPDPKVSDRNAAIEALRKLKSLAVEHDLFMIEEREKGDQKRYSLSSGQQTFVNCSLGLQLD